MIRECQLTFPIDPRSDSVLIKCLKRLEIFESMDSTALWVLANRLNLILQEAGFHRRGRNYLSAEELEVLSKEV